MAGPPAPKRQRTDDKEPEEVDLEKLQPLIEAASAVDEELEKETSKLAREIIKLESKSNIAKRPLYEKRSKKLAEIPGFWKQALSNHLQLAGEYSEDDFKVLESLTNLDVKFVDENGGYKIELTFGENPYFGKTTIWKQVTFAGEGDDVEAQITASELKWKNTPEAKDAKDNTTFIESMASTDPDTDFADMIKDELWKHPLQYFLQEVGEESDEEDGEGEDEDEDEEEAGDDEE